MQLDVVNIIDAKDISKLDVSPEVFSIDYNEGLVHQVLTSYMNASRSGTKSNLGRSEVRGGGAKPWRQKGTGRARAGTRSSPIWRSGGVTFAAKPRLYESKVNKKMYRKAIQSILSEKIRLGKLHVVKELALDSRKTKDFIAKTSFANKGLGTLFISNIIDENFYYACRNLEYVWIIDFNSINPYDLIAAPSVVVTIDVMNKIQEWLG